MHGRNVSVRIRAPDSIESSRCGACVQLSSVERMFRSIDSRPSRVVAVAAVVAFASLWIRTDRVEAGCGDYVYVRGQLLHGSGQSMSESAGSEAVPLAAHESTNNTNGKPVRLPCRGPSCSN